MSQKNKNETADNWLPWDDNDEHYSKMQSKANRELMRDSTLNSLIPSGSSSLLNTKHTLQKRGNKYLTTDVDLPANSQMLEVYQQGFWYVNTDDACLSFVNAPKDEQKRDLLKQVLLNSVLVALWSLLLVCINVFNIPSSSETTHALANGVILILGHASLIAFNMMFKESLDKKKIKKWRVPGSLEIPWELIKTNDELGTSLATAKSQLNLDIRLLRDRSNYLPYLVSYYPGVIEQQDFRLKRAYNTLAETETFYFDFPEAAHTHYDQMKNTYYSAKNETSPKKNSQKILRGFKKATALSENAECMEIYTTIKNLHKIRDELSQSDVVRLVNIEKAAQEIIDHYLTMVNSSFGVLPDEEKISVDNFTLLAKPCEEIKDSYLAKREAKLLEKQSYLQTKYAEENLTIPTVIECIEPPKQNDDSVA